MLTPRTRLIFCKMWLIFVLGGGLTVLARGPLGGTCTAFLTLVSAIYVMEQREDRP